MNPWVIPNAVHGPSVPMGPLAPLPSWARRFVLDPEPARRMTMRVIVIGMFVELAWMTLALVAVGLPGEAPPSFFLIGALSVAFSIGVGKAVLLARVSGGMLLPQLASYELLASARVFVRSMWGVRVAEVVQSDVTSIVETPRGLWLLAEPTGRALFVTRSLDGYDAVRAHVATWRPIAPMAGLAALWLGLRASRRQRAYASALADPTYQDELANLRAASNAAWYAHAHPPRSLVVRRVLLFVVVAILLTAIRFLMTSMPPVLAPSRRPPHATHHAR